MTAIPPFPANSGGATRIYHTIEYLGQHYDLYLLSFGEKINQKAEIDFLNQNCCEWRVFPLGEKKILNPLPYHFSNYENLAFYQTLQEWLNKENFDLFRVEFTQLARLVKYLPADKKRIFIVHDIALVAFYRRMKEKKWGLKKLISWWWIWQMFFYEKRWLNKYQQLRVMSATDKKYLSEFVSEDKIVIEPNGIKAINFLPKKASDKIKLGFIGSQLHPPNQGAIKYIIEQILPALDKQKIAYEFYLAGDNNLEISNKNIINLGRVEKKIDFFAQIDILVAPIMAGSGTRIKILEALSYGKPVITTKIGAEGLDIKHQYLQVVEDDTWGEKIVSMAQLKNANLAELKKQLEPYLWERVFGERD